MDEWLRRIRQRVRDYWIRDRLRLAVIGIAGFLAGMIIAEIGLNIWVRGALRANLLDKGGKTQLKASLAWLSLPEIIRGQVDSVRVNGTDCKVNDLKLSQLAIESRGFRFDLPLLMRERQLDITRLERTRIRARLSEAALRDYLNLRYPGYSLGVNFLPGRLRLTGLAEVFGSKVPVLLEGGMASTGPQRLRFYPDRLLLAGQSVGSSFLKFLGDQIPLEFTLLERWPVRISGLTLGAGYLDLSWQEMEARKG